MKTFKKIGVGILAAVLAFGATGCKKEDNSDTLVITALEQGYGVEWLNNIVDAYKKKTGNNVKVLKKIGSAGQAAIETEISSLSNKTDIFITEKENFFTSVRAGAVTVGGVKYDSYYEKLNDVYEAELKGENGATIKSKMAKDYLDYNEVDGNYYSLPWQNGVLGIVLNLDVWNKLGYTASDIPRTTDEMFEICDEIVAKCKSNADLKNIAPFIYSASEEYYSSFLHMWMAQYEGNKTFGYFLNGKDPDGEVSEYVYTFDGQEKTLQIMDRLLDKEKGYQHSNSDELGFTDMQSYFLSDQAAFCVNGSWLDNIDNHFVQRKICVVDRSTITFGTSAADFVVLYIYVFNGAFTGVNKKRTAVCFKFGMYKAEIFQHAVSVHNGDESVTVVRCFCKSADNVTSAVYDTAKSLTAVAVEISFGTIDKLRHTAVDGNIVSEHKVTAK